MRPLRLFAALSGLVLALIGTGTTPATAATPLVCTSQGSPTVHRSAPDSVELFYLYACDQSPAAVGVTVIVQYFSLQTADGKQTVDVRVQPRSPQQQSSATHLTVCTLHACGWSAPPGPGSYRALETVTFRGNFSYGSVPGCGRVAPDLVRCNWAGPGFVLS